MTDPIEIMAAAICVARDGDEWDALVTDYDRELATAALAALRETLVPVGWQRRWLYPLQSDPPGKISLWEGCSRSEATDMFKREGGCEYRPIYALPEIKP